MDIFLKIAGIKGESDDKWHKDEIDVESFSWAERQDAPFTGGPGGGTGGKVQMEEVTLAMRYSKASPLLFQAVASGKHFPSAVIAVRRAGGATQDFLKWTLTDVIVTAYATAGSRSVEDVNDQISLSFRKIQVEYRPVLPNGSLGAPVKAGWDLQLNKPA